MGCEVEANNFQGENVYASLEKLGTVDVKSPDRGRVLEQVGLVHTCCVSKPVLHIDKSKSKS